MSENKYWRGELLTEFEDMYKIGAVYQRTGDWDAPEDHVDMPWSPKPGDFVKYQLSGPDYIVIRHVPATVAASDRQWVACQYADGTPGENTFCANNLTPILNRAPQKVESETEFNVGDEIEQISLWEGEVTPNQIGLWTTIKKNDFDVKKCPFMIHHKHEVGPEFIRTHFRKEAPASQTQATNESEFFSQRDENGMLPKERELYEAEGARRAMERGKRERREDEQKALTDHESDMYLWKPDAENLPATKRAYLRLVSEKGRS